ncbi:MAG: hypothetical protein OXE02_08750 [Chloroflexi bacterium]|nr:hypothetical protein [Chloroflexota bacterium]
MTVCIAALYDNGRGVVLASDQLVTASIPIGYEFEHQEIPKIVPMAASVPIYALAAGDVLLGTEILNIARVQIQQQQHTVTAAEAVEAIRVVYQRVRLLNIVQRELEPRGLTLDSYYGNHQALAPQVLQIVDQAMSQADIGVEFIVAGPGEGSAYTIHTVSNPGTTNDHTPIGYCAIGSGAPHAMYSLIEAPYKHSLGSAEVKELVHQAKARSEVAPGVGSETQVQVIPSEDDEE